MCFAQGSIDQATKACPMCKVFKPSGARCPHIKDICHNRSVHPRFDVVHFKNAEVQTFNGCGYCKWAKAAPLHRSPGYQNGGWPGCCRPPGAGEHRYIQPADWPAVSIVHHMPIPPEVKSILDSISVLPPRTNTSSPQSPPPSTPASLGRSAGVQVTGVPPITRRTSASVVTTTRSEGKNTSTSAFSSGRSGNSPPQNVSSLGKSSRTSLESVGGDTRLGESPPGRKQMDIDGPLTSRSSELRPSITSITPQSALGKANPDYQPDRDRRRTLNTINTNTSQFRRSSPPGSGRPQGKNSSLENNMAAMNIPSSPGSASSSSSSGGSSASSDHTVDGGFTDYLSDESEAELQRQAEIRAALLAQNRMEEQEFRAARQQLAHVDLEPPKSWNLDTNRSQIGSQPPSNQYVPTASYA